MHVKKSTSSFFKIFLSGIILLAVQTAKAQNTGKLTGKITDKKSGETLIGATIMVQGTGKGTSTNVNGEYTLTGVAAGTYSILFKYVGYQNKLVSDVQIKAGGATPLNVTLDEATSQTLKEVTIKATYRQESTNALYTQQKNNAAITDGITSEAIRRSPDRNTSEVLRRVSGATVQDNKFVVVRGLSDRYNTAQLDGSNLPSTEPNRKAFSFDIVPANLVDNLIINKTATPNLPGDFAGGAVQIITKDIPDENFIALNVGLGYNSQTTFKNFFSGYRNFTDNLGFDNGSKKLPAGFPSASTIAAGLSPQQNIAALNSLNPNFNVYAGNAFVNQNYQLSLGHVKELGKSGNRLGAIFALTYRNNLQTSPDVAIDYHVYNFNAERYRFSTSVGALANFAYNFGKNRITLKNIYNRNFDDQFYTRSGTNESNQSLNNRFTAFDLIEKGLFKTTLQGDHGLGTNNSKLTWTASYSNVTNNQPDQRKTNYQLLNGTYVADLTTVGKENARFFSDLNENVYSGQVDYTLPVQIFKQSATFKAGVTSQYRDRSFDPRFIGPAVNLTAPNEIRELPLNRIFSRSVINQGYYRLDDITDVDDPYNANTLTNASYAMLDNKFGEKFRLVWGLRVEKFDLHLRSKGSITDDAVLNNLDFLPSANLTYSVTPKTNLRFSYSHTVARPELRELASFGYYDFELLATVRGNPDLQRTQIHNVDVRYEFYPSAGQILSVSGFYKNFKNAIESYFDDKTSTPDINFFNSQKANNYGIEFEIRKTLNFIDQLKNTTLYTNLAFIKSVVKDPMLDLSEPDGQRPMVGQAPYVINAGLLQTALKNKLSLNLLYNRVGPRIFRAGGTVFPSVYENARDVIDFQVGYRVFKSKGEFKLNASDVLNQQTLFYFKEGKPTYNLSTGAIYNRFKTGSGITLSYSHTL